MPSHRPADREPQSSPRQGEHAFEGDYRPQAEASSAAAGKPRTEPLQIEFLHRLADALNATLDLSALMHRVADLVRAVIDYRILGILLLNERTHELWMRFQTGHSADTERMRIKLGHGIVGQAALQRRSILIEDVGTPGHYIENYIPAIPEVRSELAVPLIVKNRVVGVIDIQSETPGFFTLEHQKLLELVASRMAVAVENARLYTRVSRQAETLTVLGEISREITSILDLDDLLERIGQLLSRVIDYRMLTILLWNESTLRLEHRFTTRYGERIEREHTVALGEGIIGTAAEQRRPLLVPDVRRDPRYRAENPETRSELAAPLIYKGRVIGVMDLEHTRLNYYNEDHLRTLTTLASQVAISIANARLYQRIHEEEQRLERDLEMAREVQLRLMPSAPPPLRNAEVSAHFRAARSIGGDLYDFLDYGSGGILLALGDVSGKAAPAALYAALVSGVLRSLGPARLSPARLLAALNDQLHARKMDAQYVTMLVALWDGDARTLTISNAGSVQPLHATRTSPSLTSGLDVKTIAVEGFPLGLFPNVSYEETVVSLRSGDLIVFFSDGIVDATNLHGEMYGSDRLCTLLQRHPTAATSAAGAVDAILEAVNTFEAGTDHFDDETIVVLRSR